MGWSVLWHFEKQDEDGTTWREVSPTPPISGFCPWGIDFDMRDEASLNDPGFWVYRTLEDHSVQEFPDDASEGVRHQAERHVLERYEEMSGLPRDFSWINVQDLLSIDWQSEERINEQNRHVVDRWLKELAGLDPPDRHRIVYWYSPP